uniref:UDP-glucuronate decarboxylase n=1 Tax=Physcomitrium patens TaxID=3218 RepID=A0A7I3ZY79_PHYPA
MRSTRPSRRSNGPLRGPRSMCFVNSDGGFNVKDSLGETRFSGNGNSPYKQHAAVITGGAGKIPLGLPRKPLRIVVTGGAGFVGSHLVDRLIERGDSVIVVDNFFTGRKENVQHHFGNPRFELIRHDVVEPLLLEVDQIYHLACPASPVHYKFNPIKTIKTNVVGTLNMLGLAKRIGARFLLTSTSEVYGDPLEHPQKETYWGNVNPIGVRSCYDEGKRTAETLAMDYHRGADVQVRIARIFNTYGPRMCIDDGRVVSNFVAQTLRKEPMTVYGDGKQTRSFQFVSDLVEGLMRLMEGEHVGPFNLGNPGEFTILELAQVVKDVIDPTATIEYKENTSDDPHKRKPDISKAKELLGWEPKISLEKGLPLMVEDFRKRIFGDHKDV